MPDQGFMFNLSLHEGFALLSCFKICFDQWEFLVFLQAQKPFSQCEDIEKLLKEAVNPDCLVLLKNQYQKMIFRRILPLSLPPCAGLVHCDICLGNLPPQPLHSFPVARGRPLSNGRFRYEEKFLFTIILKLVKLPAPFVWYSSVKIMRF